MLLIFTTDFPTQVQKFIVDEAILVISDANPHVFKSVKKTQITLGWNVLPHPLYSPDVSNSN